jgi:hypothetical protein
MQNYIIVFRVLMMSVGMPLAGFDVDLDIPGYHVAVNAKNGIFEITAAGVAGPARENYMKPFASIGHGVSYQVALPQAGDEPFRNLHAVLHDYVYKEVKKLVFVLIKLSIF